MSFQHIRIIYISLDRGRSCSALVSEYDVHQWRGYEFFIDLIVLGFFPPSLFGFFSSFVSYIAVILCFLRTNQSSSSYCLVGVWRVFEKGYYVADAV